MAELSNNTLYHSSIKTTPFCARYGRDPLTLLKYENGSMGNAELEGQLMKRDATLQLLKEHLHRAQQIMKLTNLAKKWFLQ